MRRSLARVCVFQSAYSDIQRVPWFSTLCEYAFFFNLFNFGTHCKVKNLKRKLNNPVQYLSALIFHKSFVLISLVHDPFISNLKEWSIQRLSVTWPPIAFVLFNSSFFVRERPQIDKCLKVFQTLRKRFECFNTLNKLFEMLIKTIETFV